MFKVYRTGLQVNPFLLNPIQAIRRTNDPRTPEDLLITHATKGYTLEGKPQINLCVTLPCGKSTTLHPEDLEISNEMELERLYKMFDYLGPKYGFNKID